MWFVYWDPCGLACYAFGWLTIIFVNYVTVAEVLIPWLGLRPMGLLHLVAYECLIALIALSYARAAITDPGTVQMNTATRGDIWPPADDPDRIWKPKRRFCEKCQAIKPPRAHHCSTCGRCVQRMDHHCPWVNNCVGANNMKFFLQFLFYIFLGGVYSAGLAIWRVASCWSSGRCAPPSTTTVVLGAISTVLAIFFAVFVVAMGCDQYEGLTTNTTAIEAMKGWTEENRGVYDGLKDACGEALSMRWFLPVALREESPSYYKYRPTDDPDAYDPRDPIIQKHFARIRAQLEEAGPEGDGEPLKPQHAGPQQQRTVSTSAATSKSKPRQAASEPSDYDDAAENDITGTPDIAEHRWNNDLAPPGCARPHADPQLVAAARGGVDEAAGYAAAVAAARGELSHGVELTTEATTTAEHTRESASVRKRKPRGRE